MSQETRKDPRAKVLTMTVRYKSATLDEFIEHHSYDISRGGMFIKTPSPFPPGTLLKFEVKIGDDQRLLQGVGRVVWKREKTAEVGGEDSPAGMGVKFIKINEEAQALIQDLTGRRPTGGAFEAGGGDSHVDSLPAPSAPSGAALPSGPRKATVLGLGSIAGAAESLGDIDKSANFFPDTGSSEADMPAPEDRTVMKQTSELLRDALREAGGSEEELGQAAARASKGEAKADEPKADEPKPEKRVSQPPASRRAQSRDGHRRSNRPPAANPNSTVPPARPRRTAPASTARAAAAPEREDNGMVRLGLIVAGLVAAGGVIWAVTRENAPPSAPPAAPVVQAPVTPEPPAPTAAPEVSAPPQASSPASAVSTAPSASAAPTPASSPPASAVPAPAKPAPSTQVSPTPSASTAAPAPKSTATSSAAIAVPPAATAAPTATAAPASAPPKKTKKSKPVEDSDNPY
ncbi:MAG: TIGR02266 family protein [Polyangiaceae bacterium]|nr:TIGR02266 family protein [Polyangiaceae bacterium]